eukprot:3241892-Rhodomonas_salina.1
MGMLPRGSKVEYLLAHPLSIPKIVQQIRSTIGKLEGYLLPHARERGSASARLVAYAFSVPDTA